MFSYQTNCFLLLMGLSSSLCGTFNKTEPTRSEKTFSLFSVVQFPNDVCTTTSATYSNGTCITSGECIGRGGTSTGSCAAGFGVCCVYTFSDTGSTINQNVSYLINPSYPSSYEPSSTPATISYTINKCSCDVCRIRLDFEVFQLTSPQTTAPRGKCNTDYMTFKTTAHQTTSQASGNFGNYPYMCGTNDGQHAYLDLSCTCSDTATIDFVLGDTTTNTWKIKVTQLSCDDPDVAASEGCFQYFTGETGSFESFGLASSSMICGHNYAICIRPLDGYCCIEYTPTTWDVQAWFNNAAANAGDAVIVNCQDNTDNVAKTGEANGACISAFTCQRNYVIIPGAQSTRSCKSASDACYLPKNGLERYCGTILDPDGHVEDASTATRLTPVTSCQRPFRMFPTTHDCGTNANSAIATPNGISSAVNVDGDEGATGWAFTYRQLPGNC